MKTRRRFSAEFKAKVALEAIRGALGRASSLNGRSGKRKQELDALLGKFPGSRPPSIGT